MVGRGAFGDVWLARGLTGVYRAVKVVWRDRFQDPQPYDQELLGLRDFAQVSIVEQGQLALLHVGRNDAAGFFYYVMELADDVNQRRRIIPETYRPLTFKEFKLPERQLRVDQLVDYAVELCRGLGTLHSRGLVHRDIKPSNLIIVDGLPKLADVGLVTQAHKPTPGSGTEGFMPPEGAGSPAGDIFALGMVLYELGMGRKPADCPRLPDDFHSRSDRRELMELNEIITRACDPSPSRRYKSTGPMLKELQLLQAAKSVRRLRMTEQGLHRARRVSLVVAAVAAVAFGGALLERHRARHETARRLAAEAERDELARYALYTATLDRTQRALETAEFGRARELLRGLIPVDDTTSDLRGLEWHLLWRQAEGDPAVVVQDSGPGANRVQFSPDGTWFGVNDSARRFIMYDAATHEVVRTIQDVHRIAGITSDGSWIVGVTPSYSLQAWSTEDGRPFGEPVPTLRSYPLAVVPSATPQLFYFVTERPNTPSRLAVWDFAKKTEAAHWPLEMNPQPLWEFRSAEASFHGSRCLILLRHEKARASQFQHIAVDLESGPERVPWPATVPSTLLSISTHVKGILASKNAARQAAERGETSEHMLVAGTSETAGIAFSPDGRHIAVGSFEGGVSILDGDAREIQTLQGHAGAILSLAWSPDSRDLLTCDNTGHVRIWHEPFSLKKSQLSVISTSGAPIRYLYFTADGSTLIVTTDSRATLHAVDQVGESQLVISGARLVGTSSDHRLVAFDDESISEWDRHGELLRRHDRPLGDAQIRHLIVTPNVTVAVSSEGEIAIFKDLTHPPVARWHSGSPRMQFLAVSPDGTHVAALLDAFTLTLWRADEGSVAKTTTFRTPTEEIAFSPDGRHLVMSQIDGTVLIRETTSDTEVTLRPSSTAVAAAFSPDGSRLVCTGKNGLLHIYRTTDWTEVATLADIVTPEGAGSAVGIAFSPDGRTIAVQRRDGQVRLWRTE